MSLRVTQANVLLTSRRLRVLDRITPLTFPSHRGGSDLPDSVAAAGGSAPHDISRRVPSVRVNTLPGGAELKMPEWRREKRAANTGWGGQRRDEASRGVRSSGDVPGVTCIPA